MTEEELNSTPEMVLSNEKRKAQWLKFNDSDPEAENSLEAANLRSGTAT